LTKKAFFHVRSFLGENLFRRLLYVKMTEITLGSGIGRLCFFLGKVFGQLNTCTSIADFSQGIWRYSLLEWQEEFMVNMVNYTGNSQETAVREKNLQLSPGWLGARTPKACILGLGLIGGSWAGALAERGWQVSAVERDPLSLQEAISRGWIQEGWTEIPENIDVDLVIAALPLHLMLENLDCLKGRLRKGGIVTDVGSIKTGISLKGSSFKEQGIYFIGGHPMAGSEKSGFTAANAQLFRGFPYVLTPEEDCPPEVVQKLQELILSLGAKVVLRQPPEHDREVAMISHIPHILAVALTLAAQDISREGLSALQLAGRSFREMTRIADSSPLMWQEILVNNSSAILEGLEYWQKRIDELKEYVRNGNREGIIKAFDQAHLVRETMLNNGLEENLNCRLKA
jgi:prephenate dehydrogenase